MRNNKFYTLDEFHYVKQFLEDSAIKFAEEVVEVESNLDLEINESGNKQTDQTISRMVDFIKYLNKRN